MSVGAISGNGAGAVNSSASQSQNSSTDAAAATFANWLSSFQNTSSSAASTATSSGPTFPVNLSNATAAFAAHLSNGLTIGMVALGPVGSNSVQQMAQSVEQMAANFDKVSVPASASDYASSTADGSQPKPSGVGGAMGMYDTLPDGTEIMGYTAGTASGGASLQDMTNGMNYITTNLEKALGDGASS